VTSKHPRVRNFCGVVADMSEAGYTVTSDLFPADALTFYTRFNLGLLDLEGNAADAAAHAKFYNPARGGGQGDYRDGIAAKVDNVVDCLTKFPGSKRAVLTVPNAAVLDHTVDGDAKCLRELHFYIETRTPLPEEEGGPAGGAAADEVEALHCTGLMRAQAASIFPKNIHMIGAWAARLQLRGGGGGGSFGCRHSSALRRASEGCSW
jgi:hypothetical protein